MEKNKIIGRNIAKLRKQKKLTLRQLADATGVTQGYLSKLEAGDKIKKPSYEKLNAIAKYFNVDVSYFATDEDELNRMSQEEKELVFTRNLTLDAIKKANIIDNEGNKITEDEREFMLNALKSYRESKAKFLDDLAED
ncbi:MULTISPECIES: helix-turn-helix domain-containing protein [Bacillus]|uniref:helix-turn-helix domain-containing protein n=1 Tax=Bacillus TaxID=1386 RepID=UPI0006A855F5|nr:MULTISPECIES: helix-turn-helix transcriptional regulator [Bacillus]MDY7905310.1 helix-turn-helix transcriptional regulator [Bacillus sp. AG1]QWK24619.1 helix-turn-helix transcriptional regulator [Bacillus velezensis]WGS37509.1 helix-turn-helix transcriptional regulator [Bacillus velezensis]CUB41949.1 Trifunctional NAD biosynthesis/regulator protein NadR [Bacillus amyloliquefaciens]